MISRNHPCIHILGFLRRQPKIELQFSIYKYSPQTVLDSRYFIDISSIKLSLEWIEDTISTLKPNEELAFHSKYKKGGRSFHIPMIDLECPAHDLDFVWTTLAKVLPNNILSGLIFYNSGRSLHAYGSMGLTPQKWREFMGRLLLANLPNQPTVIDTRWVGHRLLGGFSSLRWSSNSSHYLKVPSLVKK